MPIDILGLAGGALGGAGGLAANQNRRKEAIRQRDLLLKQQKGAKKQLNFTSELLKGNLSLSALSATNQSKAQAVGAFQEASKGAVSAANSNISGGTPFFQLDKYIEESATSLMEANKELRSQMELQSLEGEMQIDNIRNTIESMGMQIEDLNEDIDYFNSPAGFVMSGVTGALSGATLANRIKTIGVGMFGVESKEAVDVVKPNVSEAARFNGSFDAAEKADIRLKKLMNIIDLTGLGVEE